MTEARGVDRMGDRAFRLSSRISYENDYRLSVYLLPPLLSGCPKRKCFALLAPPTISLNAHTYVHPVSIKRQRARSASLIQGLTLML